jgi:hypothetical protein
VTCVTAALNDAIPCEFQLAGAGMPLIQRRPNIVTSPYEPS